MDCVTVSAFTRSIGTQALYVVAKSEQLCMDNQKNISELHQGQID